MRTIDNIDVDSSKAGTKYRASLDDPIMVGGAVVIPKGADATLQAVKVQQSGKMKGSDLIQLKVISVSVRGTTYPVVTSVAESKGKSEGKATARKTARRGWTGSSYRRHCRWRQRRTHRSGGGSSDRCHRFGQRPATSENPLRDPPRIQIGGGPEGQLRPSFGRNVRCSVGTAELEVCALLLANNLTLVSEQFFAHGVSFHRSAGN